MRIDYSASLRALSALRPFVGAAALLLIAGCATTDCETPGCRDCLSARTSPLGSLNQAHYDTMQANGEAADFVIGSGEFEVDSDVPNAAGRDHIVEIAARMGETPFPIIVEPGEGGAELDAARRQQVVRVLTSLGNQDAAQRTMVSRPYSDGQPAIEL